MGMLDLYTHGEHLSTSWFPHIRMLYLYPHGMWCSYVDIIKSSGSSESGMVKI
jgi:hypothetical protein